MAVKLSELDAHEQPSSEMKAEWKAFCRRDGPDLLADPRIDDPRLPLDKTEFRLAGAIPSAQLNNAFSGLSPGRENDTYQDAPMLYHPLLPGLIIIPSLLPEAVQTGLLDLMVHRDLSDPKHQTNMHLHYQLPYPTGNTTHERSFFSLSPESPEKFEPRDPSVHKPLTSRQVLQKRLHWVTLGGQYDWTNRVYPGDEPPEFPRDIGQLLERLFPETKAQAAIVNFYTPGDTMMMHRDVSEEASKGLVSLSFGCECLFMIAPSNNTASESRPSSPFGKDYLLLRLRSGDAVYMTEEARYAWHGVPKVLKGTCPPFLRDWPAQDGRFDEWRGWMANKRINLNVRQMKD